MRITAQPFGLPITKERMGKWHAPKIFQDEEILWKYMQGWWLQCLEMDMFSQDLWTQTDPDSVLEMLAEGALARGFKAEPHFGDDLYKVYLFPYSKGVLILKDADRLNS